LVIPQGNSSLVSYADDLVLICPFVDGSSTLDIHCNIDLIVGHLRKLELDVNAGKTKYQIFTRTGKSQSQLYLSVFDIPVQMTTESKYLGVILDSKLDYAANTAKKVVAVKRAVGYVSRVFRKSVAVRSMLLIYMSLFRSVLMYGAECSYPVFKKDRTKLERCQYFALKCFYHDYRSSYSALLSKSSLKPLYELVFRFKMCIIHKYVCNPSIFPLIKFSADQNVRRSSRNCHSRDIYLPHSNLSRYSNSSYVLLCKAYNALPDALVSLPLRRFKNYLKLHSSEVLSGVMSKSLADSVVDVCTDL